MLSKSRIAMTIGAVVLGCGIGIAGIYLFDLMQGDRRRIHE